ncbi:thiolase family protein [Mycetohabitans endofungorum]|uniref:thiolase family protein n=1 Tax=Mycetohabitans endofungorum TaxID=417203 RepID=UPI002B05226B|nr:hypothetical protein [Mycetohabitans endofungorum]
MTDSIERDPIVIVSVARTPIASFQGGFASLTCPQLGAAAISAALQRARLEPSQVDEVVMGCVLPAGVGQAPARQAALGAGLPLLFTTAPVGAIAKLLDKNGWRAPDVDLYEINEAFAVVTLAAMKEHRLPHEKVNVHGGACALGHPIGASGARIIATLIGALRQRGLKRGVASLCIGSGEATAMGIELF